MLKKKFCLLFSQCFFPLLFPARRFLLHTQYTLWHILFCVVLRRRRFSLFPPDLSSSPRGTGGRRRRRIVPRTKTTIPPPPSPRRHRFEGDGKGALMSDTFSFHLSRKCIQATCGRGRRGLRQSLGMAAIRGQTRVGFLHRSLEFARASRNSSSIPSLLTKRERGFIFSSILQTFFWGGDRSSISRAAVEIRGVIHGPCTQRRWRKRK